MKRIRLLSDNRGAIAMVTAVLLVAIVGLLAIVMDLGRLHEVRNELQNAADAGALAGAMALAPYTGTPQAPNWVQGQTTATNTIPLNKADTYTLADCQALPGYWNLTSRTLQPTTITPTSHDLPAIQVIVTKTDGKNNGPVKLSFAPILGITTGDVSARATAVARSGTMAVLKGGKDKVYMKNISSHVGGDIGVAAGSSSGFSGSAPGGEVTGTLYVDSTGTVVNSGVTIDGGVVQNASGNDIINQALADAQAQATQLESLAPTLSVKNGYIDNTTGVINGTAGQNVVDVTAINLSAGTLTLNAPAGASFVIRNTGKFEVKSGSNISLSGGLRPEDVIFYETGSSPTHLDGAGDVFGSLIAKQKYIRVKGTSAVAPATLHGRAIGLADKVEIDNGKINPPPFPTKPHAALVQ